MKKQHIFDLNLKLTTDEIYILNELLLNALVNKKFEMLIKDKEYGELRKETYKKIRETIQDLIMFY